jgi:hypothetical protein
MKNNQSMESLPNSRLNIQEVTMNNIPYGFLSPVLAQKKLLEFLRPSEQTDQNCAILQSNPCKDTMTNISTVPTLLRDAVVANQAEENRELKYFVE